MGNLVLQIGDDADLTGLRTKMNNSNINYISTKGVPEGRNLSAFKEVKGGESLYIISHGNGTDWGNATNNRISVKVTEMEKFLTTNLPDKVTIFLCICDSWTSGKNLNNAGKSFTVWAADGTPKLEWDANTRQITDETGRFKICK